MNPIHSKFIVNSRYSKFIINPKYPKFITNPKHPKILSSKYPNLIINPNYPKLTQILNILNLLPKLNEMPSFKLSRSYLELNPIASKRS